MSTAPWEPEPTGEGLMAPQRRQTKQRAAATLPVDATRRHGPRLRLQLPDFSAPIPATSIKPLDVATTVVAATEESPAKPRLATRLAASDFVAGLKRHFGAALRIVVWRNFALLLQPQVLLQPKIALAALGAIAMTAATLFVSSEQDLKNADQLGAAPAWSPPTIAAPDWNTVAQPVTPAPAVALPVEATGPVQTPSSDASSTVSHDPEAPVWAPTSPLPTTTTTPPSAASNNPTTIVPHIAGTGATPAASANTQATAPRTPETVASRPKAPRDTAKSAPKSAAKSAPKKSHPPKNVAGRPEEPRPYPATFVPEKPPQARITGNITVLPGEATP